MPGRQELQPSSLQVAQKRGQATQKSPSLRVLEGQAGRQPASCRKEPGGQEVQADPLAKQVRQGALQEEQAELARKEPAGQCCWQRP